MCDREHFATILLAWFVEVARVARDGRVIGELPAVFFELCQASFQFHAPGQQGDEVMYSCRRNTVTHEEGFEQLLRGLLGMKAERVPRDSSAGEVVLNV